MMRASSAGLSEGSQRVIREQGILLQPDPRGSRTCECNLIGVKRFLLDARRQIFRASNLFLVSLLILQTAVLVLQKIISLHAGNYPYVLTVTQPIFTTAAFGALYAVAKLYSALFKAPATSPPASSKNIQQGCSVPSWPAAAESDPILSKMTPDEEAAVRISDHPSSLPPIWKYALIGGLLILANFMNYAGARGSYLPGPVVVLLQQMTIPVTLVISVLVLKTAYRWLHFIGALIILVGIAVSIMPELRQTQSVTVWAMCLIAGGTVPQVCAILIMEYSFKYKRMKLLQSWTFINLFEFLFALPLVFAIIPLQHLSIHSIPPYLRDGYRCLLEGRDARQGDDCRFLLLAWLIYLLALVANKLNLSLVITRNSSSLLWIVLTAAVPLANMIFCLSIVMGEHKASFTVWGIVGLVIVVLGLILYRCVPEPHRGDRAAQKGWWTREWREA